ncbi:MAG: outer membrane beta-barrel protein [Cryomorphaceae bacterium]|nr:PorT family protein [Flavobacteriales bacterium]
MKKIAITGALICMAAGLSFAQDATTTSTSDSKLRMAISAAPVFSWFTPDGEPNAIEGDGSRFSIKYGLHMDFQMGNNANYWVSTGLFMVNTGGSLVHPYANRRSEQGNLQEVRRNVDYRLNYLVIPINFKLMTNEIGYNRYFARVGFDLGLAVNSRFDSDDSFVLPPAATVSRENASSEDLTRFYRAALHIEAGMEYNIGGSTNIMVSLEWNNGLNNVFTKEKRAPVPIPQENGGESANVSLTGDRLESVINYVAINLGIYF